MVEKSFIFSKDVNIFKFFFFLILVFLILCLGNDKKLRIVMINFILLFYGECFLLKDFKV